MALIKCPECGKEVSDQAESCPNCGCPIFRKVNKDKGNKDDGKKGIVNQQNDSDRTDGISFQQVEEQRKKQKEKNYTQRSMVVVLVGLLFSLFFKIISIILVFLGIYYIVRTKKNGFKIPIGNIVLLCIMLMFSIISWNVPHGKKISDNTQNKSQIVSTIMPTEKVEETTTSTVAPTPFIKKEEKRSIIKKIKKDKVSKKKKLSKKQYQAQCKMKYHDAMFFTKKNLKGKHVKLRLFIGEKKFFDRYVDSETSSFIKKNKIQRTYYECYIKRKGSVSYVSNGTVTVYLPKKIKSDKFRTGSYITIYGKVALFSNSTWTGYNSVSVVAKYIEKGKR